jgi:hypothetical protein
MRTFALLLSALLLSAMMLGGILRSQANAGTWLATIVLNSDLRGASGLVVTASSKCITVGGKRVCLEDDDNDDDDDIGKKDDDDDDDKPKKKKTGNICAGEVSCPAGYVVLDKPNAYGACCELKEGLPKPAPVEEKCKLGMVGTPPNCECPSGTKFFGLKGCCISSSVTAGPPRSWPRTNRRPGCPNAQG